MSKRFTFVKHLMAMLVMAFMLQGSAAQAALPLSTLALSCVEDLGSLGAALEAKMKTDLPADELVYLAVLHHLVTNEAPDHLETQRRALEAFSEGDSIFKMGKGEISQYQGEWFYRTKMSIFNKVLPRDIEMEIPDARVAKDGKSLVRTILGDSVNEYASGRGLEPGEVAYVVSIDVNGVKLTNDWSLPLKKDAAAAKESAEAHEASGRQVYSHTDGYHGTGNWLLRTIGEEITARRYKGVLARKGGDEIDGVLVFKGNEEALMALNDLNLAIVEKMQIHIKEQAVAYVELYGRLQKATKWTDLPQVVRAKNHTSFQVAKEDAFKAVIMHMRRLVMDQPSLSIALGIIDHGLIDEAKGSGKSLYEYAAHAVDAALMKTKALHRAKNALSAVRDGDIDTENPAGTFIPAQITPPFRFKRGRHVEENADPVETSTELTQNQ